MSTHASVGVRALFVLSLLVTFGLVILIVLSAREMSLPAGLRDISATLWGVTTLADLGAGLALTALWIALIERRPARVAPWILALLLLGNLTTAVYVMRRCLKAKTLREAIMPAAPQP